MNKRKPSTKRKSVRIIRRPAWGFFWHVHHDVLLEWSYDITERVKDIKANKPEWERPIRLQWMTRVKGPLPSSLQEILENYRLALKQHQRALNEGSDLYDSESEPSNAVYHSDLRLAKMRKGSKLYRVLTKLHRREHPGCSWNGKELVFK